MVRAESEDRSLGVYDLVGMSSMATRLPETMDWPVVPAGRFDFATTAAVLTGATVVPPPACFVAPCTLA